MKSGLIVKTIKGEIKIFYEPFSRPEGVSDLFVLACQRACYDRPYRWLWYYQKYNSHFSSFQEEDPLEIAKFLNHISCLVNPLVLSKFCSPTEYELNNNMTSYLMTNKFLHKNWMEQMLNYSMQRKEYLENPFFDLTEFLSTTLKIYHPFIHLRTALSHVFGSAIPSDDAILKIKALAPKVLEVGYACNGYWSYMLKQVGCDVKCLTIGKPIFQAKAVWQPVDYIVDLRKNDFFRENPGTMDDRALLFVKPQDTSVARNINWGKEDYKAKELEFEELDYWKGDTVITVTQSETDLEFDPGLKTFPSKSQENEWKLIEQIDIPSWVTFNDIVRIYKRI